MSERRNGDSESGPATKRKWFPWTEADVTDPTVQAHALLELAEYAKETNRVHIVQTRELRSLRTAFGHQSEDIGKLVGAFERMDRRTELTHALCEGIAFRLGRVDQISDANREKLRAHDKTIESLRARNARVDAEEAAKAASHAKLVTTVEHIKEDVKELEEDLENTQNRRVVTAEDAAAALVTGIATEAFRAKLSSQADGERETRADVREDRRHIREERSKTKWWLLGLIGFAVLSLLGIGFATAKKHLGVEVEQPPLPTLPTHGK